MNSWIKASERIPISWDNVKAKLIDGTKLLKDIGGVLQRHPSLMAEIEWYEELPQVSKSPYQPMSTAPRDGTKILVVFKGYKDPFYHITYWDEKAESEKFNYKPAWQIFLCDDGFFSVAYEDESALGWMPIPEFKL